MLLEAVKPVLPSLEATFTTTLLMGRPLVTMPRTG